MVRPGGMATEGVFSSVPTITCDGTSNQVLKYDIALSLYNENGWIPANATTRKSKTNENTVSFMLGLHYWEDIKAFLKDSSIIY